MGDFLFLAGDFFFLPATAAPLATRDDLVVVVEEAASDDPLLVLVPFNIVFN